ncbi:MAG: hypothetical protein IK094_10285, partial [Treponema sp.]|nr:hypothetical protein [Treponema sp.]
MKKVKFCFAAIGLLAVALFTSCSNNSDTPASPLVVSTSLFSSTALAPSESFSIVPNSVVKRVLYLHNGSDLTFEWNEAPVVSNGVPQQTTCKTFTFPIQRNYFYSDESGICGYAYSGVYYYKLDWSASNWENRLALATQKEKELAETDFTWSVMPVYTWGDVPRIIKNGSSHYLGWSQGSVNRLAGVASGVTSADPGIYRNDNKTFLGLDYASLYRYNQNVPSSSSAYQQGYYSEMPTLKDAATGTFVWTPYLCDWIENHTRYQTTLFYNDGTCEFITEYKPKDASYKTGTSSSKSKWTRNSDGLIVHGNDGRFVIVGGTLWGFDVDVT